MVRFGGTEINNEQNAAFGAFATSAPWGLVTTPLLSKLGLRSTGPEWYRASAIGGLLLHPTSATDTIQLVQVRRDRGIETTVGISLFPFIGKRSIRATPYQPEYTINDKLVVPKDIRADSVRSDIAQAHQEQAQEGLQNLAVELQRLAADNGAGIGQWPGTSKGQSAFAAITAAANEGISTQTTENLITTMKELKAGAAGDFSLDLRAALGNSFWEPGKIWLPDQFDAAMELFRADIQRSRSAS
jgi:hypothetical protein